MTVTKVKENEMILTLAEFVKVDNELEMRLIEVRQWIEYYQSQEAIVLAKISKLE